MSNNKRNNLTFVNAKEAFGTPHPDQQKVFKLEARGGGQVKSPKWNYFHNIINRIQVMAPLVAPPFGGPLFKLLEEEVQSINFGTKSVSIVGQEFASKTAVAAWTKINCLNDPGYLFCVDVHSYLALAFTVKDMQSHVQMEVVSKKAKYSSPEHMLVTKSFGMKIPKVLTKGK